MKNKLVLTCVTAVAVLLTLLFVKNVVDVQNTDYAPVTSEQSSYDTEKQSDATTDKNELGTYENGSENKSADANDSITVSETKSETKKTSGSKKQKPAAIENTALAVSASGDVTSRPETQKVSFVACGDIIVHSTVLADAKELAVGTDKEYDFTPMFSNVADIIEGADLAYINQESPFGGPEKGYSGYPMFNSPDQEGLDLMSLGFNIINIANNHMLDSGTSGYARTIEFWKKQPVTYIGGYTDEEDFNNIRVIEENDISIALLAFTYGTNGIPLASSSDMVIPLCDESGTADIDRLTKKARELADIVIVSLHWGNEDWFEPSALQKKQADIMVNNGVDVIIGSHPHVLEPMMWRGRPDGGRTLVIYSLGNFLSGMLYMRNMVGGIAGFDLVKVGDSAFVDSPYFIPTVCQYNTSWRKFKIYRFSEYTQELLNSHRCQRISDPGNTLAYLRKIIDDAIPNEFLIEDFYRN